mmetsp:Transcript_10156/g.14887  ORF Transcript_10156/g.14887 Transcript_10156/m.14887 type:complete len:187 (-) Transcript_10156:4-564(-)
MAIRDEEVLEEQQQTKMKKDLMDHLKHHPLYNTLQAQLRAIIYDQLDEKIYKPAPTTHKIQEVINYLILEYLKWAGFEYSEAIFEREAPCKQTTWNRAGVCAYLGIDHWQHHKQPLLYLLCEQSIRNNNQNKQKKQEDKTIESFNDDESIDLSIEQSIDQEDQTSSQEAIVDAYMEQLKTPYIVQK